MPSREGPFSGPASGLAEGANLSISPVSGLIPRPPLLLSDSLDLKATTLMPSFWSQGGWVNRACD